MLEYICDDIINIIIQNLDDYDVAQLRFSCIDAGNFKLLKRLDNILVEKGLDLMYLNNVDYREADDLYLEEFDDDFKLWEGDEEADEDEVDFYDINDQYYNYDQYY
jgi:hypothetical protein